MSYAIWAKALRNLSIGLRLFWTVSYKYVTMPMLSYHCVFPGTSLMVKAIPPYYKRGGIHLFSQRRRVQKIIYKFHGALGRWAQSLWQHGNVLDEIGRIAK